MLIAYNNLDKLSTTQFKGTSVGVNIEEEDDFNLTKRLPQRVKGETTAVAAGKTFGGKKADGKTAPVERNTQTTSLRGLISSFHGLTGLLHTAILPFHGLHPLSAAYGYVCP